MKNYRKKPVVIQAIQFTGENTQEVLDLVPEARMILDENKEYQLVIDTLEGRMTVSGGDYVIRGIQGEFYPCKPDVFEATYEEV